MSIELEYQHGTEVSVLRACPNPDAPDLLAVGGEHSVEVLQIGEDSCNVLAAFYIGARVTALAWSPRTTSPSQVDAWFIELVAAGEDLNLRLLTKSHDEPIESIFVFGGGLSGHRRKVNDLTWCGGFGEDSYRYLASVSDDKILLFWDLFPPADTDPDDRQQPAAFAVPYAHPLHSVAAHPSTAKELVLADAQGSVFVVDWRGEGLRVAELVDPRALADARTGRRTVWGGAAAWQQQDANVIGAAYGARWAVWDMRTLQGGKPVATGYGFAHGTHRFRWCPTDARLFALSPQSPLDDAALHIHSTAYAHGTPRRLVLHTRVRDFDWLGPRLVAALGRSVVVVQGEMNGM